MSTKYISYVYKITTKEDKTRLFIGSTREQIQNLLLFFIKNSKTNQTNKLYDWIRPLKKNLLKIKTIKSYPVSEKDEQKKREKYWIQKYETYGYEVIYNPYQLKNTKSKECKLYVCLENVSMEEIIKKYGDKIICISKNNFSFSSDSSNNSSVPIPPINLPKPNNIKPISQKPFKPLPITVGSGYLNELKNFLTLRKSSNLSLSELAKRNKPNITIEKDTIKIKKTVFKPKTPTINPGQELLKELKKTIKKIE